MTKLKTTNVNLIRGTIVICHVADFFLNKKNKKISILTRVTIIK